MNKTIIKILKFLFPEYQIIESINKHGFIAKGNANTQGQTIPKAATDGNAHAVQTAPPAMAPTANACYAAFQNESSSCAAACSGKTEVKLNGEQVESKIAVMKESVKAAIVGQAAAIDNLMVAFKRPLVTGSQKGAPRNTFFIIGGRSSGRRSLLTTAVTAAKREGLLNHDNLSTVNLSLYPTTSEKSLFLADLYKALYEQSDIVLFENFENCHADMLQVIINLVKLGKYQFGERYTAHGGNLIQATGALLQSSVSEMASNEKYFAFITSLPESKIEDRFGAKFMDRVADIIVMDTYTEDEIHTVTKKMLFALGAKVQTDLSYTLAFSKAFAAHCAKNYKKAEGFAPVLKFISGDTYKALSEYKLRNCGANGSGFMLGYDSEHGAVLVPDNHGTKEVIPLARYMPKRRTSNIDEIKAELADVVGLAKVKGFVLDLENNLHIQKLREDAGHKPASVSRHMIFTGNPGTGKTTIARIVAKYFKAIGLLSVGQLREVSRSDLVGQYVGHTAKQTNEVIQSALGGVLFIDEAYSLCRDKHDVFGLEAVDALVKAVEDYRDDLVVILAGYQDEMREFLKNNPGLKSRFPNTIDFEDYTAKEMVQIAHITAKLKGYKISDECIDGLTRLFEKSQVKGRNDGGNGRLARNVIESAILTQSKRITKDTPKEQMNILLAIDFNFENFDKFDLEKRLSEIIGLEDVKDYIRSLEARLRIQSERKKLGLPADSAPSLHMVFKGNPGTGKTMIARTVANVLYNIGIINTNKLIETDRAGLVAGYVGQTALKTTERINEALDGVLFIDEAYSLSQGGANDFGREAIDTLVKLMDDNRERLVVMLAGYSSNMDGFLHTNPGLKSRFPNIIDFPDYSPSELMLIAENTYAAKGYELSGGAKQKLHLIFQNAVGRKAFGNGRYVRNIYERSINQQALRLRSDPDLTREELTTIEAEDIEEI